MLISLLLLLLIVCVVYWGGHALMTAFGLGAPLPAVFDVVLVLIAIYGLLQVTGLWARLPL